MHLPRSFWPLARFACTPRHDVHEGKRRMQLAAALGVLRQDAMGTNEGAGTLEEHRRMGEESMYADEAAG